jgi:hypothetical protein
VIVLVGFIGFGLVAVVAWLMLANHEKMRAAVEQRVDSSMGFNQRILTLEQENELLRKALYSTLYSLRPSPGEISTPDLLEVLSDQASDTLAGQRGHRRTTMLLATHELCLEVQEAIERQS